MAEALHDEAEARLLAQLEASSALESVRYAEDVDRLVELSALSRRLFGADGVERFLALDVAATLRVGQHTAARRVSEADRLTSALSLTLAGLRSGRLRVPQARTLLEETTRCSEQVAADAERRVWAGLDDVGLRAWTGPKLVRRVKRAVLEAEAALEPELTAEREAEARRGRRVSVRPEPDGMASLWALLPAEQLRAFTAGMDELVRRQREVDRRSGADRTADQCRADVLALLPALALHALDGTTPPADGSHPAVVVSVHVPMATALGRSDAPGHLDGYGPVSAGTVRRMLPSARLRRVVVEERTGEPVQVASRTTSAAEQARPGQRSGSAARPSPAGAAAVRRALLVMLQDGPLLVEDVAEPQYEPSDPLARLVRTRDGSCTGLGCDRQAAACDLDHREPWPLGPTTARNLAPLSRRCHRAKTLSWSVQRHPDGSSTWTSPTGRHYPSPSPWHPAPDPAAPRPCRPPPQEPAARWGPRALAEESDAGLTARLAEEPERRDEVLAEGTVIRPALLRDDPPPF